MHKLLTELEELQSSQTQTVLDDRAELLSRADEELKRLRLEHEVALKAAQDASQQLLKEQRAALIVQVH